MAQPPQIPLKPSHAQLLEMLDAPDLSTRERRELRRAARMQKRIETWEQRRANPVRAQPHRVVVSLLLMAACLGTLMLLVGSGRG